MLKSSLQFLRKFKLMDEERLLEIYPPFWFMGVRVIHRDPQYRSIGVKLPIRWYGKNLNGTMFGGFMCAVADPLAALLCEKLFPGVQVWTKRNCVDFLRPAQGNLEIHVHITDDDIATIQNALDSEGQATHGFRYAFTDSKGRSIAKVHNVVFMRIKKNED